MLAHGDLIYSSLCASLERALLKIIIYKYQSVTV